MLKQIMPLWVTKLGDCSNSENAVASLRVRTASVDSGLFQKIRDSVLRLVYLHFFHMRYCSSCRFGGLLKAAHIH